MTTILITFIFALILSLALTPVAKKLGVRFGAIDVPDERKVHSKPIPRCGGMAIFLAFILTLVISALFMTEVSNKLMLDKKASFFLFGSLIVFAVGLFDDFHRLGPRVKFFFQVIAASVAFYGGLRIESFSFFGLGFNFGIVSYVVTVFWFVLFINAINLIDGLDGLAAGIIFFASAVLVILSVFRGEYLIAMLFAALGGAVLGFLRYNFNPASIFMGDGGSYFLGYAIAGLSIMGSIKSQVGAAMLIPVLAMGIPLFDTILSPIRRFVRGRKMFHPDKGHVHHRLVGMGLTAKKAVWIIYAITFCLCIVAILVVNIRDEQAGLFLIVLGAGVVVFVRKLGYFEYFASDKLYGWFKDVTDEAGFSHDRRSFLNLQIEIGQSMDLKELWVNVCTALEKLKFDMGEMNIAQSAEIGKRQRSEVRSQKSEVKGKDEHRTSNIERPTSNEKMKRRAGLKGQGSGFRVQGSGLEGNPGIGDKNNAGIKANAGITTNSGIQGFRNSGIEGDSENKRQLFWTRDGFDSSNDICRESLLKLELPLIDNGNKMLGTLWLIKDLNTDAISHYTLRRVEHLRRTVIGTLGKMKG